MKKTRSAFTLLELLIVISMMGIFTGLGAKLWYSMERISHTTNRNLAFTSKSQRIIDRLTTDIRRSISLDSSDDTILMLSQISTDGTAKNISYFLDAGELIRAETFGENQKQSIKVASLEGERLDVTCLPDGTVRIEITRDGRDRPLEIKSKRLVSFARPCGGTP